MNLQRAHGDNDQLRRQTLEKDGMVSSFRTDLDRTKGQYEMSINNLNQKVDDL